MPSQRETVQDNKMISPHLLSASQLICHHFHWKCLISSLLIAFCAAHITYCQIGNLEEEEEEGNGRSSSSSPTSGPCSNGYNLIPMALGALFYLLYLSECWHYRAHLGVLPHRSVSQVRAMIEAMCTAIPVVWWKSVSYHYLRRTRHVTRYRNGDAVSATQVYYERVNSHSSGNIFLYDQCGFKDISKQLTDLDKFSVVRMRLSKGFVFACHQAANEFEDQRARFFTENEMNDDYMEVREGLDLADLPFTVRLLVFPESVTSRMAKCFSRRSTSDELGTSSDIHRPLRVPWWMCPWVYWSASLLLFSWPLRLIAECRTAHVHFQVTKLFGTNYLSPSSVNYTGPLTRTSTMDSRELEEANRRNYLIVPSYSEAILLDPLDPNQEFTQPTNLFRQIFSSPQRSGRTITCRGGGPCSASVVSHSNYGAITHGTTRKKAEWMRTRRALASQQQQQPPRSQSISFFNEMTKPNHQTHLPRPCPNRGGSRQPPPRSLTISEGIDLVEFGDRQDNGEGEEPDRREDQNRQRNRREGTDREPLLGSARPVDLRQLAMHNFTIRQMPPPADEPPPPYEIALRYCSPIYQRLRRSVHSLSSSLFTHSSSRDLRQYAMDGPEASSSGH